MNLVFFSDVRKEKTENKNMSVLEFKSAKKKKREGFEPGSATGRGVVHHYCPECAKEFACVQGLKHHVLFQHQGKG